MPYGIVTRLNTTFTDQTLNPLPKPYPSLGVAGAKYMWLASSLTGNDGDPITSWPATVGGIALEQGVSGKRPILKIENGVKMLRFDGVDDELNPASALVAANLRTIVLVFRVRAAQGTSQGILNTSTGAIQRGGGSPTATTNVNGGGTGATNVAVAVDPTSTSQFHVLTQSIGTDQDGNAIRQVSVDGVSATVTGDALPSTLRLGMGFSTVYGAIDVIGMGTMAYAANLSQRGSIRGQQQAMYPALVA